MLALPRANDNVITYCMHRHFKWEGPQGPLTNGTAEVSQCPSFLEVSLSQFHFLVSLFLLHSEGSLSVSIPGVAQEVPGKCQVIT